MKNYAQYLSLIFILIGHSLLEAKKSSFFKHRLSHITKPLDQDCVARWIRDAMKAAGIDMGYYKAHSSRGAAVSKAHKLVPLNIVLDAAGWSNARTFAKHYKRPIEEGSTFAKAILQLDESSV